MATPEEESEKKKLDLLAEMEWLDEPREFEFESQLEYVKYKIKRNPFVPIGCIATITVLGFGLSNFARGGSPRVSQKLMRWRVGLQGATISSVIIGLLYDKYVHSKKKIT